MRRLALLPVVVVFAFGCGSAGAASLWPIGDFDQPVYASSAHGRLLLSAKRLRPGGLRFKVKVRLAPCRGSTVVYPCS